MVAGVNFEAPDLARKVEAMSEAEIDTLPFGVIRLDQNFIIQFYSATESRLSGYGRPIGENFFEISESPQKRALETKIRAGLEEGKVDLDIGWRGGKGANLREVRIRVQSAKDGGVWMFFERDEPR